MVTESVRMFDAVAEKAPPDVANQVDSEAYKSVSLPPDNRLEFDDVGYWSAFNAFVPPAFLILIFPVFALFPGAIAWILTSSGPQESSEICLLHWIVFPVSVFVAMFVTVPMFWHVSVWKRFCVSGLIFLPLILWFAYSSSPNSELFGVNFQKEASRVVLIYPALAAIGLALQIWSPWTLVHHTRKPVTIRPTSTAALLELIATSAVTIALISRIKNWGDLEYVIGVLILEALVAITFLLVCATSLRETGKGWKRHWSAPMLAAIVVATIASGFVLMGSLAHFGATASFDATWMAITLGHGVFALMTSAIFGAWWLRRCRWKWVLKQQPGPSVSTSPDIE